MDSSASLTKRFGRASNALRKVKLRSWFARIIWSDCTRSSAVFHTSTSAASSSDRRVVSGAGACSLIPKKTRALSSLHASGARSLMTQPLGRPSAFAASSTTGSAAVAPSFSAAVMSGKATSTLSRSRIFSTSLPLSTARPVPASFHWSRLYSFASLSSTMVRPFRVSNTKTPFPSFTAALTVKASRSPARLNAISATLPSSWWPPVRRSSSSASLP